MRFYQNSGVEFFHAANVEFLLEKNVNFNFINFNRTKKIFLFGMIFCICLSSICAKPKSKNKNEEPKTPIWILDEGRYKLFPQEEFVSALGTGFTEQEAQNRAASLISRAIKTKIKDSVESSYQAESSTTGKKNSTYNEVRKINQNIKTEANNTLYQLHFTPCYFDSNYATYQCVAYIERDEAWNLIEPKLQASSKAFEQSYKLAKTFKDLFKRVVALKKSQALLNVFYEAYDFALFIKNDEASKYKVFDELAKTALNEIDYISKNLVINVVVDNDSGNRIKAKITERLTETGFVVGAVKNNYEFYAQVVYDMKLSGDTWLSYPSIKISVLSDSEIVATYAKELEKCAAFDKDALERRIFFEFESEISKMKF